MFSGNLKTSVDVEDEDHSNTNRQDISDRF